VKRVFAANFECPEVAVYTSVKMYDKKSSSLGCKTDKKLPLILSSLNPALNNRAHECSNTNQKTSCNTQNQLIEKSPLNASELYQEQTHRVLFFFVIFSNSFSVVAY